MMENKFTPRAEEAQRLAQEAAEDMGHGYVGSEHLLLGLLREEEGIAHQMCIRDSRRSPVPASGGWGWPTAPAYGGPPPSGSGPPAG